MTARRVIGRHPLLYQPGPGDRESRFRPPKGIMQRNRSENHESRTRDEKRSLS